ncbi:hypothetical protein M5_0077 [Lysinibacillus phage vB_LfM_LysYB2]|nr:hypothetical protein M5_0077 [Lysinibacillus phage vB_LfM_LysYB2]
MREISFQIPKGFSNVLASQIEAVASAAVSSTLMATKSKWETIAQQRLTTTRNDYLLGLNADDSMTQPDAYTGVLVLRGKWPNMLETGFQAYDMKPGFMSGPRVKQKKDGGWYTTIPFRHTTPGSTGSAVGGKSMPDDIYSQARALRGQKQLTGTETSYPAKTSWAGYQHKSGIYEGMRKNTKQYDKATQNSYFTFRRVSDKSDPESWKHPGFPGVKALDVVEPWARETFAKVFNANIKNAMGG